MRKNTLKLFCIAMAKVCFNISLVLNNPAYLGATWTGTLHPAIRTLINFRGSLCNHSVSLFNQQPRLPRNYTVCATITKKENTFPMIYKTNTPNNLHTC